MELILCPNCQQENQANAMFCGNCGSRLPEAPSSEAQSMVQNAVWQESSPPAFQGVRPSYTPSPSPTYSPSRKYAALQGVAALCATLSIGVLILAGLGVLGSLILMTDSFLAGFGALFLVAINATPIYIFLRVVSESIFVILDIESNTRNASISLERMEKLLGNVSK